VSPSPDRLLVGVFGAPHGVRGEVRLKSYTQDPAAIAGYALTDATGRNAIRLSTARLLKDDLLVVRVEGVASREAAAALTGASLYTSRASLPAVADDEFYHADLVGLRVETPDGEALGTLTAVLDFGAGDILEITPTGGGRALLWPFTRAVVPLIDLAGGRLVAVAPHEIEAEIDSDAASR
jgi:16S rRNA processing protein RimM